MIAAYVGYLLETRRDEAAGSFALKLASMNDPADRPLLLARATGSFKRICLARRTIYGVRCSAIMRASLPEIFRLRESATVSIGAQPISRGWFRSISIIPPRRRIAFDGRQPESCEVLRQAMPVEPGRRYSLALAGAVERVVFAHRNRILAAGEQCARRRERTCL